MSDANPNKHPVAAPISQIPLLSSIQDFLFGAPLSPGLPCRKSAVAWASQHPAYRAGAGSVQGLVALTHAIPLAPACQGDEVGEMSREGRSRSRRVR